MTLSAILAGPEFVAAVAGVNLAVAVAKRSLAKHRPVARDAERMKALLFVLPGLLAVAVVEGVWGGADLYPVRAQLYGIVWASSVAAYDGGKRFLAMPILPAPIRAALASYLAAPADPEATADKED